MNKWTRERIIRDILRREADGLLLTSSATDDGVEQRMYQAASRIFGSWRNAVIAAGLPPSLARTNGEWTPSRIRKVIRSLSRRKQPLRASELKDRYGHFIHAARRHFGSWAKAVMAAGIDPQRMRRSPSWSKERVIEGILTRALRNEPLERRFVQPRAFVEAGTRLFGSWKAALTVAGVAQPTTKPMEQRHTLLSATGILRTSVGSKTDESGSPHHRPHTQWTERQILDAVMDRNRNNQLLYATAVYTENRVLYRAATRRFGNWKNTLIAAGLDPMRHQKHGPTVAD